MLIRFDAGQRLRLARQCGNETNGDCFAKHNGRVARGRTCRNADKAERENANLPERGAKAKCAMSSLGVTSVRVCVSV